MVFISGPWDVALAAAGVTLLMRAVQAKVMGPQKEVKRRQDEMKKKQDKMMELHKKDPNHPEIAKLEAEITKDLQQMMKGMMWFSLAIIPVIPVFHYIQTAYADVQVTLPVLGWTLNWFWWYFATAILFSIALNAATIAVEKAKGKKAN